MSSARVATFLVWALAAAAVFWSLRLFAPSLAAPPHARPMGTLNPPPPLVSSDLSRLLGPDEAAPAPATVPEAVAPSDPRFQLLGVVAAKATGVVPSVALIAVDGKPARAYRVGALVAGDTVLRAVHARGADLGPRQGPVLVSLQLTPAVPGGAGAAPGAPGLPAPGLPPGFVPAAQPQAAPPPAMPGTLPPGRVLPGFVPQPGMPGRAAGQNPQRLPYGATPPAAPGQPALENLAPEGVTANPQNPATDVSPPVRRRNQPPDALR